MTTVIRVTVIGSRPYTIGGHDSENPKRVRINSQISKILAGLQKKDTVVLGITDLTLGVAFDFVESCEVHGIEYEVYLSSNDQEQRWRTLPGVHTKFKEKLKNAIEVEEPSEDKYSPRKQILNRKKMVKDADIIIYLRDKFKYKLCSILEYAKSLDKKIIFI